ncbi:hypothetical protein BGZ60DRAFT_405148 [Tricladium varicosporioides]|nr:hypothetical protein BGZ60DRAFT_405148 [Hymenoscyphus varicosporioides]
MTQVSSKNGWGMILGLMALWLVKSIKKYFLSAVDAEYTTRYPSMLSPRSAASESPLNVGVERSFSKDRVWPFSSGSEVIESHS